MPLIGTAGHVDHGKSTLIERITGRDPDRWDEEKRRGLTIDLGFAWATLPSGIEVSFVDVPGHERYLKNMLAGIEAIDVALFVVAADEGWMPQSEEHLAVLDLLGVSRGVVAVTKVDAVDDDLADLAALEVNERLEGSALEGSPIVRVSAVTGEGVDDLIDHLERLAVQSDPRDIDRPRLWVDRSFSATGAGTVVTGTLLDGSFEVEDAIRVYPGSSKGRIRGIQSHERSHESIGPGRRVALNLSGIDRPQVTRGDMVAFDGDWVVSDRLLVTLRTARYVDDIDRRGAYQMHVGSSVHRVELTGLSRNYAVAKLANPIPVAWGDRYIIRDTGRKLVVAGGQVLDPYPAATRTALSLAPTLEEAHSADSVAQLLLNARGTHDSASLRAMTCGGRPADSVEIDGMLVSPGEVQRLTSLALDMVEAEHHAHPLREGLSMATLATRMEVTAGVAEFIVNTSASLERRGPEVSLVEHRVNLDERDEAAWHAVVERLRVDLAVPVVADLGIDPELLHLKIRSGELVSINDELVYLPEQTHRLTELLRAMEGDFTVAQFRDAAGLSRKYAVPILEWADKRGLTVRRGDTRRAR